MPSYYNPYMTAYPISYGSNMYPQMQPTIPVQQYMINVDGESAARAWQIPSAPQPNTIVPLFDTDGQHVYFKSYDAYGRMNPIRKGRIVFDDEIQMSEAAQAPAVPDMTEYVKSDEMQQIKEEIESIKQMLQKQNNQNGTNNRGDRR